MFSMLLTWFEITEVRQHWWWQLITVRGQPERWAGDDGWWWDGNGNGSLATGPTQNIYF